jgi:glucosamine-6-phosphate deaminase
MRILLEPDYAGMSLRAARLVAAEIQSNPQLVLGLATGSTPLGVYGYLKEWTKRRELSFAGVTTFNLDEYVGLSPDHPQSYHHFMQEQLFGELDVSPERTHLPSGSATDAKRHCEAYDRLIVEAGGIDVQLLGIGRNGHIGFNEPGEAFGVGTHVVRLQESTRLANARFFERLDDVPTEAVTMGLKSIMNTRMILLLASGADKADAVYEAMLGPVTPDMPASILQMHPNCFVIIDDAAAAKLPSSLMQKGEFVR